MAEQIPPGAQSTAAATPPPVVVKKYANRRLYNTETSSYITLDNLADMIRAGRDFAVYDAKSAEDITRSVLTQIIVEEESKGSALLPTTFLRQLIGFYGDSLQGVVPRYLEQAMSSFARQQQQMRSMMQQTFGPFLPAGVEEMGRQNLAMIERAMSIFNMFHRNDAPQKTADATPGTEPALADPKLDEELHSLRREVESLRSQLAVARAEAVAPAPLPIPALPAPVASAPSLPASAPEQSDAAAPSVAAAPAMAPNVMAPNVMADPEPAPVSAGAMPIKLSRKDRIGRSKPN